MCDRCVSLMAKALTAATCNVFMHGLLVVPFGCLTTKWMALMLQLNHFLSIILSIIGVGLNLGTDGQRVFNLSRIRKISDITIYRDDWSSGGSSLRSRSACPLVKSEITSQEDA